MFNMKTKEIAVLQRIERGYATKEEIKKILNNKASELFPETIKSFSDVEIEFFNKRLAKKVE